jgi:hypothetical protein
LRHDSFHSNVLINYFDALIVRFNQFIVACDYQLHLSLALSYFLYIVPQLFVQLPNLPTLFHLQVFSDLFLLCTCCYSCERIASCLRCRIILTV